MDMDIWTVFALMNIIQICGWTAYLAYIIWDYRRWNARFDRLTGCSNHRRGGA